MKWNNNDGKILITELSNLQFNSKTYPGNLYNYNPVLSVSSWFPTEIDHPTPIMLPKEWIIIPSKKYGESYFYNTATKQSQWTVPQSLLVSKDTKCIGSLTWTGNSCFIDSVLQPLFIVPNEFTDIILKQPSTLTDPRCQDIVGLQRELNNIVNSIRNNDGSVNNVTQLRSFMKHCILSRDIENIWDTNFHDAGEFLTYLIDLFPNTNIAKRTTVTYGTNDLVSRADQITDKVWTSEVRDDKASVVVLIDALSLLAMDDVITTQNLLTKTEDSELDDPLKPSEGPGIGKKFRRRITTTTIVEAPMIILNVTRNNPLEPDEVVEKQIIPLQQIAIENGTTYNLSGITIFRNGHYVAYYKCHNTWYFYNDMESPKVTNLGDFDNIFKATYLSDEPEVMVRGTIYYYTKN
jgi:hypothetical protein